MVSSKHSETINQVAENVTLGGFLLSLGLVVSANFFPFSNPKSPAILATAGSLGIAACAYLQWGRRDITELRRLQSEHFQLTQSLAAAENDVRSAQNRLETGLKQRQEYYEALLSQERSQGQGRAELESKYQQVKAEFSKRSQELKDALATVQALQSQVESFDLVKSEWGRKFDEVIRQNDREIAAKDVRIQELSSHLQDREMAIAKYEAQIGHAQEMADLRSGKDALELKERLEKLGAQAKQIAGAYNQIREEYLSKTTEFSAEFEELNRAVASEIPSAFDAQLSERDRILLEMSGRLSQLQEPRKFPGVTDAVRRANLIIEKVLEFSNGSIRLHRNDIESGDSVDKIFFEVDGDLTTTVIDSLNQWGASLQDALGNVLKPVEFKDDRRLGFVVVASVMHSRKKADASSVDVDRIWMPAARFEREILGLLKKPNTRVMGGTGDGKGVFTNNLISVFALQPDAPTARLHDPMDGSSEDHWLLPKKSKGDAETKQALRKFKKEFDRRKSDKVFTPHLLEIFDEIDNLGLQDQDFNKDVIYCSTGVRHVGMRAIFIGQSPSVGKKGWQWADMDLFNCVYVGSSAIQAINNSPALQPKRETLEKQFQKLSNYCEARNQELGLDGGEAVRFALIVSGTSAKWIEVPPANFINTDLSKLAEKTAQVGDIDSEIVSNDSTLVCPQCGSEEVKKRGGDAKKDGVSIKKRMVCKSCSHKFDVTL